MIYRLWVLGFGVLLASASYAAEKLPLDIEASEMVMSLNRKNVIFTGDVKVVRGDLTLTSNTLTAQQNTAGELEEIVAIGNVRLTKGNEVATGKQATYLPSTEMVTLSGDVTLQRGASFLKGDVLRYNLKDGTLKLNTNKGKRVRATITPQK